MRTRTSTTAAITLILAGGALPASATPQPLARDQAPATSVVVVPMATHDVTVRCQLVRIRDNNVVRNIYGYGAGSSKARAYNAAVRDANTQVPFGHYKRHCHESKFGGGGGRFSVPEVMAR